MCTLITLILIGVIAGGVWVWSYVMIRYFPDSTTVGNIKEGIWQRYTKADFPTGTVQEKDQKPEAERIITYIERVIDRQINKARGILPFNSIVIAALALEKNKVQAGHDVAFGVLNVTWLVLFAMLGLALSSVLCLYLFFVRWASSETYTFFHKELESSLSVILSRSKIIECATIFSIASLGVGGLVVALIEWLP